MYITIYSFDHIRVLLYVVYAQQFEKLGNLGNGHVHFESKC